MRANETEELISQFLKDNNEEFQSMDTVELISKLRPAIVHKCNDLKLKRNATWGTATFITCSIFVFIIGSMYLFSELIDLNNELIELSALCLAIFGLVVAASFVTKDLFQKLFNNSRVKLRGELL